VSCAKFNYATLINTNLDQADLRYGNFKGANLSYANLSRAFLNRADLNDTRLINTNLSGTYLRDASLIGANLIGSNLKDASLINANLIDADLSGANVEKARFGNNQGITKSMKDELIKRGAIFVGEPPTQDSIILVHNRQKLTLFSHSGKRKIRANFSTVDRASI
jgi:hypothetical protein